ncbi:MAG: class I SAM-dependent methyltransferase [Planctomycetota bacterium]|nr:class I SAM-dependent methyltransferase [Planctomycetota bacterium]
MSYAGREKYDEPGRAERYKDRSRRRNEEEWRLLAALLDGLPETPRDALDVPCGTGRIAERLLERGIPTRCADLSPAMREATEARLGGREGYGGAALLDLEDAEAATPHAADLVVCFRFLHHLPTAAHRARVWQTLRALTRSGGHLLVSFHHPVSAHNLDRLWKRVLLGRKGDRYTLGRGRLRREASAAGLEVVRFRALAAFRRELWVALLKPSKP